MVFILPARAQTNLQFWQSQSIYQVITDRYYNGDPSNDNADGNYDPAGDSGTSVHGGDFKGLEKKLDYIKGLGATAIWISPIVVNANGEFHGYAGRDFFNVDPHWGSLADLQHMIQAAHARGLLVIDDIVCNHGGDLIYSTDSGYGNFIAPPGGYNMVFRSNSKQYLPPFDLNATNPAITNLFHNNGLIQNFNDTNQVVFGELSGLDDFKTESPYVRNAMTQIYEYWIGTVGFDAFRIDTVKHVDMGFWQTWCPAVHAYAASNGLPNFFMFGEIEDGSDTKVGSYTGTKAGGAFELDSTLDYPLYYTINSVFATASGNTKQIEDHYNAIAANYDPAAQMRLVTFLDNHDQPRFMSSGNANGNTNRLNVALAFLYTSRGIPCLYYGTEQDFNGGADPNNREDMFAGQFEQGPSLGDNFNMSYPRFQLVAMLNNFRRLYPALRTGSHVNQWNTPGGPGLFAYQRLPGTQGSSCRVQHRHFQPDAHESFHNLPGGDHARESAKYERNHRHHFDAADATHHRARHDGENFYRAVTDAPAGPSQVTSNFPTHAATNVGTISPVVLRFSKSMDPNSVQAAFSISPAVSGTFSWSAAHDVMTFIANGGLPALTTVTVQITNTAMDAVSGNTFYAAYQMFFSTGQPGSGDITPPSVTVNSPTNGAGVAGNVVIAGTASDNVAVQKVEVSLDSGAWLQATGTTTWSYTLNTSNLVNGPHTFSARATDSSGNVSSAASIGVRFINVPGEYLQRISGGNPTNVSDCSSNVWLADVAYTPRAFGYVGGTNGYLASNIVGVCASAQSLYQREHYSTSTNGFAYQFDCPPGVYETTLLEAETYWSATNQRVFNVFIQGQHAVTNLDIFAVTGGSDIPWVGVFTNTVTNTQLQALFTPVLDNARVSGIQVRKIGDVYSDTDGIPDWWRLAYFGHATGSTADNSRGSDDADGDGASNLNEFLAGTNPLDATSVFRITQTQVLPGAIVQINWSSVTNRTYQLQRRDDLSALSVWVNVGPATNGNGGVMQMTDSGGGTSATRYYRVEAN